LTSVLVCPRTAAALGSLWVVSRIAYHIGYTQSPGKREYGSIGSFVAQIGLLGTGKPGGTPGWLLPHFAATIQALSDYEPQPFPPGTAPPTLAIWCTDGVCPNPDDPRPPPAEGEDPAPMKWLLNNRSDFLGNGWQMLLDESKMTFSVMAGNHFTMMKEPYAETLGRLIREGLSS